MNRIGVETTQHVQIQYNVATVADRITAYLLDAVSMGFYALFVFWAIAGLWDSNQLYSGTWTWTLIMAVVIPLTFYHLIFEILWNGKTVGKWALGIQVVKVDGTSADLGNYLIRWMFRLLEITGTGGTLAFITILINGKGQRLGDLVAKTCVIKTRKKVTLEETIYANTDENYVALFPQVRVLSDEDIRTIKVVLDSQEDYDFNVWYLSVERTANIIRTRLNVTNNDLTSDEFLRRIISDYNHLFRA